MASRDVNDLNTDNDDRNDDTGTPTEGAGASSTGMAAGSATGATAGPGLIGGMGGAVMGGIAARDMVDDEQGGRVEPDHEANADSFAGGDAPGPTPLVDNDRPA